LYSALRENTANTVVLGGRLRGNFSLTQTGYHAELDNWWAYIVIVSPKLRHGIRIVENGGVLNV